MTEQDRKYPILFGDGRIRPVGMEFIKNYWEACWDSVVSLRRNLDEAIDNPDFERQDELKLMAQDLDGLFTEKGIDWKKEDD